MLVGGKLQTIQPFLSKLNFALNRNPLVERSESWQRFIPTPFHAVCTITADFELAWAWRYMKGSLDPEKTALEKARQERENIPMILELCDQFDIPITWATVGHLFLDHCNSVGLPHEKLKRLPHFENDYWKYNGNDWFEHDPRSGFKEAPEWYAPDLVEEIMTSKAKHEIGCHTFSHIDCRDEVCPAEVFEAEIDECRIAGARYGLELKSFVHPGFTIGKLDNLAELGFSSFQSDPGNILGYPVKRRNGLWELKRTSEFVYRPGWSDGYHIYRYTTIVRRAIRNHSLCNFWFHPSVSPEFLSKVLPAVFKFIDSQRDKLWTTTVGDYVDWLSRRSDA